MADPPLTFRRLVGLDRSGGPPPQTRRGEPLNPWTIPNAIGFARLALVPLFLVIGLSSGDGRSGLAFALFAFIAWSDYFDGMAGTEERELADRLYGELREQRLDVLYDDRDDAGPGQKFADAELIGAPLRLTVGRRTLAAGELEVQVRRGRETRSVSLEGAAAAAAGLWRELP